MDAEWVRWALGAQSAVTLAMFAWIMKALSGKADNSDLREHIAKHEQVYRDVVSELHETNRQLGHTNSLLANLSGRFDERARNGNHVG